MVVRPDSRIRRIADVAPDIELIADGHGWETFGTWGDQVADLTLWPVLRFFPKRVTRCATVGGLAPYGTDFEWFANMSPGNVEEFKKAIAGEAVYRPLVEQLGRQVLAQVEHGAPAIPLAYGIPASDMDEMRRRLQILLASSNELAVPGSTAQTDGSTTASRWSIRGALTSPRSTCP